MLSKARPGFLLECSALAQPSATQVQSMPRLDTRLAEMEELARSQAVRPASPIAEFGADEPLPLDAGVSLAPFQVAYQTYGDAQR